MIQFLCMRLNIKIIKAPKWGHRYTIAPLGFEPRSPPPKGRMIGRYIP